jgi:N-hydroxyarylamine O-acetyltransferase
MMNIDTYLQRFHYTGSRTPTLETLRDLHRAHLLAVPFENLSIHLGESIILDETRLFDKVVNRRRGGFCYELNGLFAWLLRELGYNVTLLSAGVANGEGVFGPEFDHMTLMVTMDGTRWLADVGFGDSFREPLPLDAEVVSPDPSYRVAHDGDILFLQGYDGTDWRSQYRFTLQPRAFPDYEAMCHYHQTSPESHFTQRRVCSLATPDGRVTLSEGRLIITRDGDREEQALPDEAAYIGALHSYFDITLPHPFKSVLEKGKFVC